jgi:hypothetical protein
VSQQQQRKANKHAQYLTDTRFNTLNAIDDFNRQLETNLNMSADEESTQAQKQKLIKTVVGNEAEGLPTLTYIDKDYLNEGLREAQKIMQEHSEVGIIIIERIPFDLIIIIDFMNRMDLFDRRHMISADVNLFANEMPPRPFS